MPETSLPRDHGSAALLRPRHAGRAGAAPGRASLNDGQAPSPGREGPVWTGSGDRPGARCRALRVWHSGARRSARLAAVVRLRRRKAPSERRPLAPSACGRGSLLCAVALAARTAARRPVRRATRGRTLALLATALAAALAVAACIAWLRVLTKCAERAALAAATAAGCATALRWSYAAGCAAHPRRTRLAGAALRVLRLSIKASTPTAPGPFWRRAQARPGARCEAGSHADARLLALQAGLI
jgi:hypothetical protein